MTGSAQIGLVVALSLAVATFASAQNDQAAGGYRPEMKKPNFYYYDHDGYYAPPRRYGLGPPYWVLGYPVPHYGYRPWRRWW